MQTKPKFHTKNSAEDKTFILRDTGLKIQNPKVYIFVKLINILHFVFIKLRDQ